MFRYLQGLRKFCLQRIFKIMTINQAKTSKSLWKSWNKQKTLLSLLNGKTVHWAEHLWWYYPWFSSCYTATLNCSNWYQCKQILITDKMSGGNLVDSFKHTFEGNSHFMFKCKFISTFFPHINQWSINYFELVVALCWVLSLINELHKIVCIHILYLSENHDLIFC